MNNYHDVTINNHARIRIRTRIRIRIVVPLICTIIFHRLCEWRLSSYKYL